MLSTNSIISCQLVTCESRFEQCETNSLINCALIERDMTEDEATKSVINDQLPAIARAIRLGEISVDNIDVFCEKGVFELSSTKAILEAGRTMGFRLNFHAEEIHPLGGSEVHSSNYNCPINAFCGIIRL